MMVLFIVIFAASSASSLVTSVFWSGGPTIPAALALAAATLTTAAVGRSFPASIDAAILLRSVVSTPPFLNTHVARGSAPAISSCATMSGALPMIATCSDVMSPVPSSSIEPVRASMSAPRLISLRTTSVLSSPGSPVLDDVFPRPCSATACSRGVPVTSPLGRSPATMSSGNRTSMSAPYRHSSSTMSPLLLRIASKMGRRNCLSSGYRKLGSDPRLSSSSATTRRFDHTAIDSTDSPAS
mmetsp:Transcript_35880/g.73730  ORF Transcript_35880/g.73730 Transcript_35880/m.73730 type:complete len:241 (+) Transcript_35880:61-783(+)